MPVNLRKLYSVDALARAGAFIRLQDLNDEIAYLKTFIAEHDEAGRKVRKSKTVTSAKAPLPPRSVEVPPRVTVRPVPTVEVATNGKVRQRGLLKRVEELVRAKGRELRPFEVLQFMVDEGWDVKLPAVSAALRNSSLQRRKDGVARGASTHYWAAP